MATYLTNTDELTQIASAIRRVLNTNTTLNFPYIDTINAIAVGNWKYDENIANPSQIIDTTCISIKTSAFAECSFLTSVSFPACATIGEGAFAYCTGLTSVSFPACATIREGAFNKCNNLSEIYLAKNSVATLVNTEAFGKTQITPTTGSIRVPSNLVNSYKTATNWTYFKNRIFAI